MKLTIDNRDDRGAQDYTRFLDLSKGVKCERNLNRVTELRFSLIAVGEEFIVPVKGALVTLGRTNGSDVFKGYIADPPTAESLGWIHQTVHYRYNVVAVSYGAMLDQKAPPPAPPFVVRSAGDALRHLSDGAMAGWLEYSGVQDGDTIPYYVVDRSKRWSDAAAEIGMMARSAFHEEGEHLIFAPLGLTRYLLDETAPEFSPGELKLVSTDRTLNDLTVVGELEPTAHVTDYFVGDGFTTKFYLSQIPFTRTPAGGRTMLDEEYATLDPTHWKVEDPSACIDVSGGKLVVAGGTGFDGQTHVDFVEKIELGGATVLAHGDFAFTAPTNGVIGGLYGEEGVTVSNCLAGFQIAPSGANCTIRALIGGAGTGTAITTLPGHRYVLTTQLYADEVYRMEQVFHSAEHASGNEVGGEPVPSNVRAVLEVHDIDPQNPGSQVAPATVLFDGVLTNAPGFVTYALVNAMNMECSVAFTRITMPVDAMVRSTIPEQTPRTRRTGGLLDGAECNVSEEPSLRFYPQYVPAANELIQVTYRGRGRARARVTDSVSVVAHRLGNDDGVRGAERDVQMPAPRTSADCERAGAALLEGSDAGWTGEYSAWSPFLPGGARDIFPGDGLDMNVPSRAATFSAIVTQVETKIVDLIGETSRLTLRFVDAGDPKLDFAFRKSPITFRAPLTPIDVSIAGAGYLPDLSGAAISSETSTSVTIDAGFTPGSGEGIEVRRTDAGWGPENDRNLIGRFSSRSFTVPRYGQVQDFFLRRYDSGSPRKYSRYSAALHLDYPL